MWHRRYRNPLADALDRAFTRAVRLVRPTFRMPWKLPLAPEGYQAPADFGPKVAASLEAFALTPRQTVDALFVAEAAARLTHACAYKDHIDLRVGGRFFNLARFTLLAATELARQAKLPPEPSRWHAFTEIAHYAWYRAGQDIGLAERLRPLTYSAMAKHLKDDDAIARELRERLSAFVDQPAVPTLAALSALILHADRHYREAGQPEFVVDCGVPGLDLLFVPPREGCDEQGRPAYVVGRFQPPAVARSSTT